jgi:hypothetical protein
MQINRNLELLVRIRIRGDWSVLDELSEVSLTVRAVDAFGKVLENLVGELTIERTQMKELPAIGTSIPRAPVLELRTPGVASVVTGEGAGCHG